MTGGRSVVVAADPADIAAAALVEVLHRRGRVPVLRLGPAQLAAATVLPSPASGRVGGRTRTLSDDALVLPDGVRVDRASCLVLWRLEPLPRGRHDELLLWLNALGESAVNAPDPAFPAGRHARLLHLAPAGEDAAPSYCVYGTAVDDSVTAEPVELRPPALVLDGHTVGGPAWAGVLASALGLHVAEVRYGTVRGDTVVVGVSAVPGLTGAGQLGALAGYLERRAAEGVASAA
ncbi:hypothetical protein P0W64_01760 [Tsukamurella sp. 8F]|uniref:hypothetical protein n=1 Tax=unclassified Tsukamurella TaxID=2633480 RepID=UPI0023BA3B2F|nr:MULTISPECIES: hypothetical protein [unclassified Tsukamurella]MDF0531035.1 hypothetical protein [Tsukamurella sp. 8J]MDF0585498.1 hypothetical protein [Tsukamurella sp. 8F]